MKRQPHQVCVLLLLVAPLCNWRQFISSVQASPSQCLEFNEAKPQFGGVTVGKSSAPKLISISNVSGTPIFLSSILATQDFEQHNLCPVWLAEGSGCTISVTFSPTMEGQRIGELDVKWVGGQQSIPLAGFGLSSPETPSTTVPASAMKSTRSTNTEEAAQELRNDKRYSFEALLNKNPADVANAEKVFALIRDTWTKRRIASVLVHIGVPDRTYLDYLIAEAQKALAHDRDIPWPIRYGRDRLSDSPNPAFVEWVERHGLPFWDAYNVSVYEMSEAWYYLGAAGDPRAYDLLIKGLSSSNLAIAQTAAEGLAKLHDPRAIDELIATGRQMRGESRLIMGRSLLFFADPRAQSAAEELMPDKKTLDLERREVETKGTKVLFPW